jgi:flagellar biosynthesis protein FliR
MVVEVEVAMLIMAAQKGQVVLEEAVMVAAPLLVVELLIQVEVGVVQETVIQGEQEVLVL